MKSVKIDALINDIHENIVNKKKLRWSSTNEYIYIPSISEYSINEKADLWWYWFKSKQFRNYLKKKKYNF